MPMTYAEAQDYLFALRTIGSKFGLERMRALYDATGRPGSAIPTLHVAGTNGKGSVCAMAEAILRANGYRTGLFTSPHLLRLGERVQVNRQVLGETEIIRYVQELRPVCEAIAAGDMQNHPTFFELMTVIALLHFEHSACEVIVMETGLGGRLDSTNVLHPAAAAITSIGLDHQEILGNTLEKIALEKAGIIKQGVPLVLGRLPKEAELIMTRQAETVKAPVVRAGQFFTDTAATGEASPAQTAPLAQSLAASEPPLQPLPPLPPLLRAYPQTSLCGDFQRRNAAVALLLCEQLQTVAGFKIDEAKALAALRGVEWAGRWQQLRLSDGRELILDASHNEEGARALEENLSRFVRERGSKPVVITGALGAERARSLLAVIARYATQIILVEVAQPRACSVVQLQAAVAADFTGSVQSAGVEALFLPGSAPGPVLAQLAQTAGMAKTPVVVTGSIYLIGEILTRLYGEVSNEAVHLQDKIPG